MQNLNRNIYGLLFRYVHSMNRAGLTFSLTVNHLADRSVEELAVIRGAKGRKTPNKAQPFPTELCSVAIPDSLDWRLYGASFWYSICVCDERTGFPYLPGVSLV